jgi:beta-glucosidase
MNEPFAFTALGYMIGMHAPGKMGAANVYPAIYNAALCTAEGGRIIREHCPHAVIGTSFSISETKPFTSSDKDIAAANRADALLNRLFIEPVLGLGFPQMDQFDFLDKLHIATTAWRFIDKLKFDFDYIGLQNYFSVTIKHNPLIPYVSASEVSAKQRGKPHTAIGWEIDPVSFYGMLKRFGAYDGVKQIIVTEGGACFKDHLHNGVVDDIERIEYFRAYIAAVLQAKKEGVPIGGYYAWTLTDNFEWAYGYSTRFGLVHTDFETQLRTVKNSGYWFRDFLNGKAV